MPTRVNVGTGTVPLKFAKKLAGIVNAEYENGNYLDKVTPITRELLKFWFDDSYFENRNINFHEGQKQAILNTIFIHEIMKTTNVVDTYTFIDESLLAEMDLMELKKEKYQYPKYAMRMATGTGKTWVLHALLIWQYLNSKHEDSISGKYSKNFLLVAPGLIVYERLLDAYKGKETEKGNRDFETSDFKQFESLFIPDAFKDEIFGFIQNNVCMKEEIGRKVTGDGLIAITNWHLLAGYEDKEDLEVSPLENPQKVFKDVFPITPGTSAGHALDSLDNNYFSGREIQFLQRLENMVVFNDEAHHIHESKAYGEIMEVEWQKSLTHIARPKGTRFIQIDFSATPYDVTSRGKEKTRHFFPHIVVDFDLKTAIHKGLIKTIALDKRKELASIASEDINFKAERDGRGVIGLSDGQRIMLRAGLAKMKLLEEHFVELTKNKEGQSNKHPKMFVICEDTKVSPYVVEFLTKNEGLNDEDVVQIDSNSKGDVTQQEWAKIKQRLFNVDKHASPKVIVSVLMLREGFDINNICVVVPLRASQSPILLEQTIGRGLRQMWREPEYQEVKTENRVNLLQKKTEPVNYMDILSIIEHPAFVKFYDELIDEVATIESTPTTKGDVLGDIINVGLKTNYKDYDIYIPILISDKEEYLLPSDIDIEKLEMFKHYPLEKLKSMVPKSGEVFFSEEMTVKTRFGNYEVRADLFNSQSYNEFISKIVNAVNRMIVRVGARKTREFPTMQVNQAEIAKTINLFIRYRLFGETFNPYADNNWRILLLSQSGIIEHIIREISKAIYELQNKIDVSEAVVDKRYFSEVASLRMREKYCLDIEKIIYEKQSYPSNKGGLEKAFMEFCDTDSEVISFIKVNENYHTFAHINYIRVDGMLAFYSPDFIVRTKDEMYIVETKAQDKVSAENVKLKQLASIDWSDRINELKPEDRNNCQWEYILLGEKTFYDMRDKGASISEIFKYVKITKNQLMGTLL